MSTAKKLVDQMLGEAEVNATGAPPPPSGPREEPTNMAGEKVHVRPDEEDLGDELDDEDEDGIHNDPEASFEDDLQDAISNGIENARIRTYSDVGMLTRNKGLVVSTPKGTFHITIVRAGR
jgi:hypothetical protein